MAVSLLNEDATPQQRDARHRKQVLIDELAQPEHLCRLHTSTADAYAQWCVHRYRKQRIQAQVLHH